MRNQIKYSQIYGEVLKELGDDMSTSFCYVPKKVVVRMWMKLPKSNYLNSIIRKPYIKEDLEIIYDM